MTLQIRLPRSLLERIDRFRLASAMRPTRSMAIRFLLDNAMTTLERAIEDEPDSHTP